MSREGREGKWNDPVFREFDLADHLGAFSAAFTTDNTTCLVGCRDGVSAYFALSGKAKGKAAIEKRTDAIHDISFSRDGSLAALACADSCIYVIECTSGEKIKVLKGHQSIVNKCQFLSNPTSLVSVSWDKHMMLWDIPGGHCTKDLMLHSKWILDLSVSPNGELVASVGEDKMLCVAQLPECNQKFALPNAHDYAITAVAFSEDSSKVFTGSKDRSIKLWDVERTNTQNVPILMVKQLRALEGSFMGPVFALQWMPNSYPCAFVSAGSDKALHLWIDTGDGNYSHVNKCSIGAIVKGCAVSPDGKHIAIIDANGRVAMVDFKEFSKGFQHSPPTKKDKEPTEEEQKARQELLQRLKEVEEEDQRLESEIIGMEESVVQLEDMKKRNRGRFSCFGIGKPNKQADPSTVSSVRRKRYSWSRANNHKAQPIPLARSGSVERLPHHVGSSS